MIPGTAWSPSSEREMRLALLSVAGARVYTYTHTLHLTQMWGQQDILGHLFYGEADTPLSIGGMSKK